MKIILLILLLINVKIYSQFSYSGKIEAGYLNYQTNFVDVDPNINWKGYNLNKKQNGVSVSSINGISFNQQRFFTGIGVGYLNFEGINGVSVFSDFEYSPLKTRIKPLIDLKIGYSHIWNQYKNGKGSFLFEPSLGLSYELNKKIKIYVQSGLSVMQEALFIPIRTGIRF